MGIVTDVAETTFSLKIRKDLAMRFRMVLGILVCALFMNVLSYGSAQAVFPGDAICEDSEVIVTPYALDGWVVSNNYNGTFEGSYMFTPNGLEMVNPQNLSKVFLMKEVNVPLSEIDSLDFDRTGTATYQLAVTGWSDGDPGATLVWEQVYNDPDNKGVFDGYWWRTGTDLGVPNAANQTAEPYETRHQVDLDEILTANPNLMVVAYGVSYGSYQPGTSVLKSITFDCKTTYFVSEPLACDEVTNAEPITFSNRQGWDLDTETGTSGYYEFVAQNGASPQGLLIHTNGTTGQDKVKGYYPINFHLKEIGTTGTLSLTYAAISGYSVTPPAGLQLKVDLDNNGTFDGYMAYEPGYYGDVWWSNSINTTTFPGLPNIGYPSQGYPVQGEMYKILDAYPDAHALAVGFALGSGVFGGGIIQDLTIGCVKYTFAPDSVEPDDPTFNEPTCSMQSASVSFPDNDFVYEVMGETTPGSTVEVNASLKASIKNKMAVGEISWSHTFVTVESLNCPVSVMPENPQVTIIPEGVCGVEGSVTPATTEHITYLVDPVDPIEGFVVVTHEVEDGFVSTNPDWQFAVYLGDFVECVDPIELMAEAPVFEEQTCETPAQVVTSDTDFVSYVVTGTVSAGQFVEVGAQLRQSVDSESYTLMEPKLWSHTFDEAPDCTVEPTQLTATAPTFVEETCSVVADVITPEDDFIKYDTDGSVAAGERVTVTAELRNSVDPTFFEIVGSSTWIHDFSVAPDCSVPPIEVETVAPEFVDPTCEVDASINFDNSDFIRYSYVGEVEPSKSVTVSAELRESVDPNAFTLTGDTQWSHTYPAAPDCTFKPTVVVPKLALFDVIEPGACNEVGLVEVPDDTDQISYSVYPENPTANIAVVLAVANAPTYTLPSDYSPQVIDLGDHTVCGVQPTVVETAPPLFADPTCEDPFAIVLTPTVEGIDYTIVGSAVPGGVVLVIADSAGDTVVLEGDKYWVHQYPRLADLNCEPNEPEKSFTFFPYLHGIE